MKLRIFSYDVSDYVFIKDLQGYFYNGYLVFDATSVMKTDEDLINYFSLFMKFVMKMEIIILKIYLFFLAIVIIIIPIKILFLFCMIISLLIIISLDTFKIMN